MCMLYCSGDAAQTHSHQRDFVLERQVVVTRSCVENEKAIKRQTERGRKRCVCLISDKRDVLQQRLSMKTILMATTCFFVVLSFYKIICWVLLEGKTNHI